MTQIKTQIESIRQSIIEGDTAISVLKLEKLEETIKATNLSQQKEAIQAQIVDTKNMSEMASNHPLMSESLTIKIIELQNRLSDYEC